MAEHTPELSAIVSRLERVEKENRRLKRAALGILVLAGAVLLMGQARPDRTIEAQKFVLKDATGKARAVLGMFAGRPTLSLYDAQGFPVVSLAGEEGAQLVVSRTGGQELIQIGSFGKGTFGVAIYGKDTGGPLGRVRAALGVVKGTPGLDLYGEDPTASADLSVQSSGPSLTLSHSDGYITLDQTSVELSDKQGFQTRIGSSALQTLRTGETHKTSAASLVMFGKDGKVLWSAP